MKSIKKIITILLALSMVFLFAACTSTGNGSSDDPEANQSSITAAESDTINSFLDQYNLNAENPVTDDDISDVTENSATITVGDTEAVITAEDDDSLTLKIRFKSLDNDESVSVIRDLIIAESPDTTYDSVSDMMDSFRSRGTSDKTYDLDGLSCRFEKDGDQYTITVK